MTYEHTTDPKKYIQIGSIMSDTFRHMCLTRHISTYEVSMLLTVPGKHGEELGTRHDNGVDSQM